MIRELIYLAGAVLFGAGISLLVCAVLVPVLIPVLRRLKFGQEIREEGPAWHAKKSGTPTMGGIAIAIAVVVAFVLSGIVFKIDASLVLCLALGSLLFGVVGFTDDYIKVFKKNKEGLSEKAKLAAQAAMALAIGLAVCFSDQIVVRENVAVEETVTAADSGTETEDAQTAAFTERHDVIKSTKTTIPFVKDHEFDYKWLSPFKGAWGWYCKWAIYVLMIVIVITACSNGVNLTDGMDGLAAGTSAIVGVVLGIFAWLGGNIVNADYLNIMYIPGSGEVAVFMSALVGALIGFLWYNTYPAQVFMGDTGSLMLGGIIGVTAVLIRKELLIPILCGVFFAESVSVLMQRFYFKYTKKKYGEGRRIFKMAPLHHHYQKEGIPSLIKSPVKAIPEAKIVTRFWIIGMILAALTIALLKLR